MNHHIILTSGRSGSNYLTNTLNQHPKIVNYGEILASMIIPYTLYDRCKRYKLCNGSVIDYLNYAYTNKKFFYASQIYSAYSHFRKKKPINFKTWKKINNLGTKDFFFNYHNKNAVDFLLSNQDIAIIYLYRENMLRRYISGVFLNKNQFASTEKNVKIRKVNIDLAKMMTNLNAISKEVADEQNILKQLQNHRLITIKYEDYFADEKSILAQNKQVFEFLDEEPIHLTSKHKKILPHSWRDQIENYDEFCDCLANTEYHQYLD
ncbi:sulfotransferase [Candidatus Halobeggiatoa sp. HSG11]|nr:sulfotransferase [Candidatus Halobeggiatoa sp. HSG11]